MNPKHTKWKSLKYRRWLRENAECPFCARELLEEPTSYQGHHHNHSGGENPSDHLIIPMCIQCHNEFHANEHLFKQIHCMEDGDKWLSLATDWLVEYLDSYERVNPWWFMIEALRSKIEEVER